jgi:hypothetical protein
MADTLHIADQYRTNPLSLRPGGYEVRVIYNSGKTYVYDKIKDPSRYVSSMNTTDIYEIWVDGQLYARRGYGNNL